jgi:HK97 family phage prohead protease
MTIVKDAGLARASMPLELKAGASEGTFEGYGAIFGNVDRDGDTVARGAFAESLKARLPMLLWQHDAKSPIGRFDEVREDERGLYVRGRLSMSGRGAEAYELLRMGALDGLSIGFVTREATRDAATGTRTILKADLMEISLVTFPANELARITSVKSAAGGIPDDPRAFEHFLRNNGFSRTRARTITAKGFGGEPNAHAIAALVADVKKRQAALEGKGRSSVNVDLFPGESSSGVLAQPGGQPENWLFPGLPKGRTTFQVIPPHREAYFDCAIRYWAWTGKRYEQREVTLWQNERQALTVVTKDTPADEFNPLSLADWRTAMERLVFDKRTTFQFKYHSQGERTHSMDGAARVRQRFIVKAT